MAAYLSVQLAGLVVAPLTVGSVVAVLKLSGAAPSAEPVTLTRAQNPAELIPTALMVLVPLAVSCAYCLLGWRAGATPVMRFLGLRIVRARDGRTETRIHVLFARWLLLVASVVQFTGLPLLAVFLSERRRSLHDLLTGTAVVYATEPQEQAAT